VSTPVKTQADFQRVTIMRIEEAEILLNAGKWDGAYYVAGYSVECALKSCIIKKMMGTDAFPDKKFSEQCYQHNLTLLLRLAALEDELNQSGPVATKWAIVKDWSEQSRYEFGRAEQAVRDFYTAIIDPAEGVLPWIRSRW
jgi:hypothetical protein